MNQPALDDKVPKKKSLWGLVSALALLAAIGSGLCTGLMSFSFLFKNGFDVTSLILPCVFGLPVLFCSMAVRAYARKRAGNVP